MKQAVTMKTQAETEQENDSKSTENQNHFQYSILNQPTTKKGPIGLLLIVASIVASGSGLIFGYELADISGALLQLSTEFHLTCAKQEIIVSAIIMGGIVGSLSSGYIIDRWERRMGIIVTSCCYILGAVILSASTSYAMLMGGRIIVGIGTTSGVIAACIYLSEVAPPDRRGMLVSLTEFMTVIGVLLAYVFNYTFSRISNGWRYMFAIVIPIAVLQVIGIFFLPPSPRFMVKKGNDEKASLVLKKIRSYSNVDDELANIKSSLTNENNYNFLDLFRSNNLRMRFCIGFGLAIFLQATVIWVLLSEIFPVGIKGRAVALIACLNWALNLLIALTFLSVTELIGLMWVLLIYAIVSFIGLPFIIFIVPETKGQTLEEISEQLNQGYNRTPICCTTEHIKRLIPGIFRKQRDASCEKKLMEKLNVRCQLSSMESPCRLSTTLSSCLYPQKIYKTLIPSCLQKVVLCGLCLCPKHRLSCTLDAA
ncbi:solute carrier family 2, facilitated glucose transporter member 12 isoform X6 [Chiloscyllium plagiosum]|uniref:solute carrier family 2, facilitated glucose transporter member 12 isoform X6 n=1 Tax=Chiloscyllium plagiosum TaxID=36176 RepID=UPI001CB7CF81|nr:solute carrier family 2, facilitated glucose transporter member 12 isoform X6 [Chiloscyllium plagiosum]